MSKPDRPFKAEDPLGLVPVVLETSPDDEASERMARTFIEEFMMMGRSDEEIEALFHNPFYRATHDILRARGESYVRALIEELRNG